MAKTYRPERWRTLLRPILQQALSCARKTEDSAAIFSTSFELLSIGESEASLPDDLAALEAAPAPTEGEARVVLDLEDLESDLGASCSLLSPPVLNATGAQL
jgi:hypothetical protein